jgi:hypothetical protein
VGLQIAQEMSLPTSLESLKSIESMVQVSIFLRRKNLVTVTGLNVGSSVLGDCGGRCKSCGGEERGDGDELHSD